MSLTHFISGPGSRPHGLLWDLGIRILRLRLRARRSKAWPMVPPDFFEVASPWMLPLYQITQPPMENSTRRAPEYTSRSPKSWPSNSSEAKTPRSMDSTPSRSIATANTRANLQCVSPSFCWAMAALSKQEGWRPSVGVGTKSTYTPVCIYWENYSFWIPLVITHTPTSSYLHQLSKNKELCLPFVSALDM